MKQISILTACLILFACANTTDYGVTTSVTQVEFAGKTATPAEIANCEAAGGSVSPQGIIGADFCIIPYVDAGQTCTDGTECLGDCRADPSLDSGDTMSATSGVCQADNSPFGCYATIESGRGSPMLCVD